MKFVSYALHNLFGLTAANFVTLTIGTIAMITFVATIYLAYLAV